jgi:hypothetical protein
MVETIDSTIEPKKAGIKPSILNPVTGVRLLASKRVRALITNVNKPKVIKVIGNVSKARMGRIIALTNPITAAPTRAAIKLFIINP